MVIDLRTSLSATSVSAVLAVVERDRRVGTAGLDFAREELGDRANLTECDGDRTASRGRVCNPDGWRTVPRKGREPFRDLKSGVGGGIAERGRVVLVDCSISEAEQ